MHYDFSHIFYIGSFVLISFLWSEKLWLWQAWNKKKKFCPFMGRFSSNIMNCWSCTILLKTAHVRGTGVLTIGTGAVFPTALGELNAVNRFVALPLLLFADSLLAEAGVWAPPVKWQLRDVIFYLTISHSLGLTNKDYKIGFLNNFCRKLDETRCDFKYLFSVFEDFAESPSKVTHLLWLK